nr:unnamed protein product [Callosobruchus analis]
MNNSNRVKRGWFNLIGSTFKTIFGTLDQDDAEYYNNAINKVSSNERHLIDLLSQQTQVVKTTITNFNHTIGEDKYQTIAMDPYEKEIARLRALYKEVLADEAAGLMENDTLGNEEAQDSDGSIDGEDNVIFSDHDSDTEQEGDILDEIPSEARVFEDADPRLYYYGKEMVSEYMSTRMSTSGLHTYIQNAIHKYSSITPEAQPGPSRGNRGKCKYCAKRKTRYSCNFCKCRICLDHITACCTECVERQTK